MAAFLLENSSKKKALAFARALLHFVVVALLQSNDGGKLQ